MRTGGVRLKSILISTCRGPVVAEPHRHPLRQVHLLQNKSVVQRLMGATMRSGRCRPHWTSHRTSNTRSEAAVQRQGKVVPQSTRIYRVCGQILGV